MMLRYLLLTALLLLAPHSARALDNIITVTGEATISVPPDSAVIRLGVSTRGKTARDANDANAAQMGNVLGAVKAAGIPDKDIQTSRLSLQPQTEVSGGSSRLVGFQATNQITVTIQEIDKLSSLLDRAVTAGANEMSGIEFVVSDYSRRLDQARTEAVADARRKADIYARAAGVKLGRAVSISEENSSPPRPMQAMRAAAVPIAPGEQKLQASVTVSYELTP